MIKPSEKHIIISATISIIVLIALLILGFTNTLIINPSELATTLLTTSGVFIGFIISALGIYYSIPLREEIKVALIKQGYYKQVARNFITSIICFSVSIAISIVAICIYNTAEYLLLQHTLNTFIISTFLNATILLIFTSINFFKIVTKN